jgi:hypothetical protein
MRRQGSSPSAGAFGNRVNEERTELWGRFIALRAGEEKWIFAQLWNGDAEFDHYQFRLNSGGWEDVPKTNTRDFTGRLHGWGLDRFSVEGKPGVYDVTVRVVRHDGSTGPESSVKFRVK